MTAVLLTISLFAFWGLIGYSAVLLFPTGLRNVQNALLAPAIGLGVTIIPTFFINRAGVPVREFGLALVCLLVVFAMAVMLKKRPRIAHKEILPYLGILLPGLFLTAWPMIQYGFNWISYANDDMANYCLAAKLFYAHGFFDVPDIREVLLGHDYSIWMWPFYAIAGVRPGSELLLALTWAATGLNAHQIFMPAIVALHLVLISATGALVAGFTSSRMMPKLAMILVALSPLTTVGVLYQLIGQVGGLALLCSTAALLYRVDYTDVMSIRQMLSRNVAAVISSSALLIWYPEVTPFLGLGWIFHVLLLLRKGRIVVWRAVVSMVLGGIVISLLLNVYLLKALVFLAYQSSTGARASSLATTLFPYFVVPSGLAATWGFIPFPAVAMADPYASIAILAGAAAFGFLIFRVLPRQVLSGSSPAILLLVMLAIALLLFFTNQDFGLFKLAMYAQPFVAGALAIHFSSTVASRWKALAIVLILIPIFSSQYWYVRRSVGDQLGSLVELPGATSGGLIEQLVEASRAVGSAKASTIVADTSNVVAAKFLALYDIDSAIYFPGGQFFLFDKEFFSRLSAGNKYELEKFSWPAAVDAYEELSLPSQPENTIKLNKNQKIDPRFGNFALTISPPTIFNQYIEDRIQRTQLAIVSTPPSNHLVFMASKLGCEHYSNCQENIAFTGLENDPLAPGRNISALGRRFIFMVLNPTPRPRLVMELTSSLVKQASSALPNAAVQKKTLGFIGRGSGRIFSDPLDFDVVDGMPFLSVDMGTDGQQFPNRKTGLMHLYGSEARLDRRYVTTFGRDMSLVSEEQYRNLRPPARLEKFPQDLANKNLEYSGIYEDGWVSEASFYVLEPESGVHHLVVRGMVPQIADPAFNTALEVTLAGKLAGSKNLGLGSFEFRIPVDSLPAKPRIDLAFSRYQVLPGGDGRAVGAKITYIGFE